MKWHEPWYHLMLLLMYSSSTEGEILMIGNIPKKGTPLFPLLCI